MSVGGKIIEVCSLDHVPIAIEPGTDQGFAACLFELKEIGGLAVEQARIVTDFGGDEYALQLDCDLGPVGELNLV